MIILPTFEQKFKTILADPPWPISLTYRPHTASPYSTMSLNHIEAMDVANISDDESHLYLWIPNSMIQDGLNVMKKWGFTYKTNLIWHKIKKDMSTDGSGLGHYFRNATEILLFGTRGKNPRTLPPARSLSNVISAPKTGHSRKPHAFYDLIEQSSPPPYLELFARNRRDQWTSWGNETDKF